MHVSFHDVAFTYRGRPVLHGLNLGVERGEMVALVGRSGAGKTTILKLVNRLLLPSSGTVFVEERSTGEWDGIRLRRRIGYVFQDVGLFPHMSVEENVTLVPRLEGWRLEQARARSDHLLDLVGLPPREYAWRRPHELSGGQRQRVGLARALAIDPPILLMDEPFGALDPVTRLEVRRAFMGIQQQLGTTVIVVTHDMGEAFALGRRVGVLEAGRLLDYDTPARIAASGDAGVRAFVATLPSPPLVTPPPSEP